MIVSPVPAAARRLLSFPEFEDFVGARVFPMVEKSSWLGAAFGLLAFVKDGVDTGGADPFWLLLTIHGASTLAAVASALVARHRGPTQVKLLAILVLGMVSQILLVGTSLFVLPRPGEVPALLSFFFLSFLFLAPLVPGRWLALFLGIVVLQVTALVLGAQVWFNLDAHSEGPILGYLIPSLVFIAWLALWSREQARESYLLARSDHSHLTLDGLSSVLNRTSWWSRSEDRWRRTKDSGAPSAVIMADIDWFKRINDTLGHDVGDQVIRAVALVILERTREADLVGRLGGEEFGVFLPGADRDAAVQAAERIRSGVEALPPFGPCQVTVSLGVCADPEDQAELAALVKAADQRLYDAKAAGRNRVAAGP